MYINVLYFKKRIFLKLSDNTLKPAMLAIIMYILFIISFMFDGTYIPQIANFSVTTLVITGIYLLSLYKSSDVECLHDDCRYQEDINLKRTKIKLSIQVIIIVIVSILLAHTAEKIVEMSSLSQSAVCAILIGISTSLPEIITCLILIKVGKFEMAIASIIGSNTFNFLTFTLLDYMSMHSIYSSLESIVLTYAIVGLIFTIIIYFSNKIK